MWGVVWYWYGIPLLINLGGPFDYSKSAILVNVEHCFETSVRRLGCYTVSQSNHRLLSYRTPGERPNR